MIVEKVVIVNYKSLGLENNCLDFELGPTAIIGKNESGKSNVLEAIGILDF